MASPPVPSVTVALLDAERGERFAELVLPSDALPLSFRMETTLHFDGQDWDVLHASPEDAEAYVPAGRVELRVRRRGGDAGPVRFPRPTLCPHAPAALVEAPLAADARVLEMAEEDWRQVECVPRAHAPVLSREMAAVERIVREEREGRHFRRVHVRQGLAAPLTGTGLTREGLVRALGEGWLGLEGVCWAGATHALAGTWALRGPHGLLVYGEADAAGALTSLAVVPTAGAAARAEATALARLLLVHQLVLVDWAWARAAPPLEAALVDFLSGGEAGPV